MDFLSKLDERLYFLLEAYEQGSYEDAVNAAEQYMSTFSQLTSFFNSSEDKQQSRDLVLAHLKSWHDEQPEGANPIFFTLPSIFWEFEKQALKSHKDWKFIGVEYEGNLKNYFRRGMPGADDVVPIELDQVNVREPTLHPDDSTSLISPKEWPHRIYGPKKIYGAGWPKRMRDKAQSDKRFEPGVTDQGWPRGFPKPQMRAPEWGNRYLTPKAMAYIGSTSDFFESDSHKLDGGWLDYCSQFKPAVKEDIKKLENISNNGAKWVISVMGSRDRYDVKASWGHCPYRKRPRPKGSDETWEKYKQSLTDEDCKACVNNLEFPEAKEGHKFDDQQLDAPRDPDFWNKYDHLDPDPIEFQGPP